MREEPAFALVCWTLSRILVGVGGATTAQQATDDYLSWGFLLNKLQLQVYRGGKGLGEGTHLGVPLATWTCRYNISRQDAHTETIIRYVPSAQNWCVVHEAGARQATASFLAMFAETAPRSSAHAQTQTQGCGTTARARKSARQSMGGSHQRHIRWLAHAGLAITMGAWGAWRLEGPRAQHIIIGRGRIAYAPPPPHAAPSSSVFVRCYFRAAAAAAAAAPRGRDAAALPQA
jgi:hypothetical protein